MESGAPSSRANRCLKRFNLPSKANAKKWIGWAICLGVVGFVFILVAAFVPGSINKEVDKRLQESVTLDSPSSMMYEGFQSNRKTPVITSVYVMDILNAREVLDEGAKPVLLERGPYVYLNYKKNYNISWTQNGEIVHYRQMDQFIFDPSRSVEPTDDRVITSMNVPFAALRANAAMQEGDYGGMFLTMVYKNTDPVISDFDMVFARRPIREILFGYHDVGLQRCQGFDLDVDSFYSGFLANHTQFDADPATVEAFDVTNENTFSMYTGKNHPDKIRQYTVWKNMTYLGFCIGAPNEVCPPKPAPWGSVEENTVRGGDGSQFITGGRLTKKSRPEVMMGNLMRHVAFEFSHEVEHKEIKLWRYKQPHSVLQNRATNPANSVFNYNGPDGFANISVAGKMTPLFVSKPHWIDSDATLNDTIVPIYTFRDPNNMETYFDIEPHSGATFRVHSTSQVQLSTGPLENVPLAEGGYGTWFPKLQRGYYPIFWARQEGEIPDFEAGRFVSEVYGAIFIGDVALYVGAIFGTISWLVAGFIGFAVYRAKQGRPLTPRDRDTDASQAFFTTLPKNGATSDDAFPRTDTNTFESMQPHSPAGGLSKLADVDLSSSRAAADSYHSSAA